MEINSGFVLGTLVAILIAFVFYYKFFWRGRKPDEMTDGKRDKGSTDSKRDEGLTDNKRGEDLPVVPVIPAKKESISDYIRNRQQSDIALKQIFIELIRDKDKSNSHFETGDILSALESLGYSVRSLVSWFNEAGYILEDLTKILADYLEGLSNKERLEVLFPLAKGETAEKRIQSFLGAVGQTWDYDESDFADLAEALLEQNCALEDVVGALYRETDMTLGGIIEILPAGREPDLKTSARLAKNLKIDLSDEHKTLFGEKDLAETVDFLREYGMNVEETMRFVSERESLEIDEAFDCFLKSYSRPQEVISALLRSQEIEGDPADIVAAALERKISVPEIAECLKEEDVDLEELDDGMRDADVGIEDRISILYAIISSKERNENSV